MKPASNSVVLALVLCVTGCTPSGSSYRPAPELDGALTWLNAEALRLSALRGNVVLLDFFEYSCVNCLRTLPYLQEWDRRYRDHGLVIIGIHSPQYDFSSDPQNVYRAVQRLGLTYPIAVDSHLQIAQAYGNRYWPRKFLIDAAGRIRFDHIGEGAYEKTERMIQQLLREVNPHTQFPAPMRLLRPTDDETLACYPSTPELYLGWVRGRLGNAPESKTNAPVAFSLPSEQVPDVVYAHGVWEIQPEYIRHARDTEQYSSFLHLTYRATEVNVVMKPEEVYWMKVLVTVDGQPVRREHAGADIFYEQDGRSFVKVDQPRMYNLTRDQPYGVYQVRLYPLGRGLSVYSFSFGTCEIPLEQKRWMLPRSKS